MQAKYGGKVSSIFKVKYLILKDILFILYTIFPYIQWPGNWTELVEIFEICRHEVKVDINTWKAPTTTRYKLNTNGSALSNLEKIGGGGILRNQYGNIIYAFAIPLEEGINNQEELQADIYGLQ